MTATALVLKPEGLLSTRSASPGVSGEAETITKRIEEVLADFWLSAALSAKYVEAHQALVSACEEASRENWDGYGARPFALQASAAADRFLRALPTTAPSPEISVDPDGEIAFEWYLGPRRVLSVSVGSTNQLTYAALLGPNIVHGTETFVDELPPSIVANLSRLLSSDTMA